MIRLFLRFYLGVICILFVSLGIMAYAFHKWLDADFDFIQEKALGAQIMPATDELKRKSGAAATEAVNELQSQVDYPVRALTDEQLPIVVREWLSKGSDVVVHVGDEITVLTPLASGTEAVRFGPITLQQGVIETDAKIIIGALLALVAAAIALLLRPLARQLSVLEQTAIAIAGGNLSARVDEREVAAAVTLARAFNVMALRTETMLRTQRELLQAVSHELRTPLARMTFAIDLIRTARDERDRESRLDALDTAAQELDELVGELLGYVRLETAGLQPACERIELSPLVEELIAKYSVGRDSLQFEIGPELSRGEASVVADRSGLVRALGNLLANAGRFGRKRVVVDVVASSAGVTIDVDDDGPGIPEPDRERVFEPFVRLEETEGGVGLGLALVKRIVANHSGTATALCSPLGGCRIRTFWPAVMS